MAEAKIKVSLKNDIKKVWDTITSLTDYKWRSDLSKIEIVDENKFIEYTKKGYATNFTVTAKEQYKRWEFDMENDNMKGHWTGLFSQNDGQTEIEFIESVQAKKVFMKPFVKGYLKKQQARYIEDLKRALV